MICNSFYHSAIHRWSLLPPFKTQASGLTNLHIQPSRNCMEILCTIYMVCSITVQAQVSTTKSSILANRLATENIRQCWTVRTMRTFYTDGHQLSKWRDRAHGFLSSPRADGSHRCCRRGGRWTGRPVVLLLVLTERLLEHVLEVMEPPLLLSGCVSPERNQLWFIVHDLVEYFWTPREEALPKFHWYTKSSCN